MSARLKPVLRLETEWVQGYARAYLQPDSFFTFPPERLRRARASLLDVREVFRSGEVVYADKLDGPGALWIVEGEDCDGLQLRVTIVVVSNTLDVQLVDVER